MDTYEAAPENRCHYPWNDSTGHMEGCLTGVHMILMLIAGLVALCSATQGSCISSEVPADPKFRQKRLVGDWIHQDLWHGSYEYYDKELRLYEEDGVLKFVDTRRYTPDGPCEYYGPVETIAMDKNGVYELVYPPGITVTFMEATYNYFVVFICEQAADDGTCLWPVMESWFRTGTGKGTRKKLQEAAQRLASAACVDQYDPRAVFTGFESICWLKDGTWNF